jgi:hypothetical protein
VTFESTALNAWIPACWKLVWNVDPAALMVPLAVEVDGELEPELLDDGVDEDEPEEHAASSATATTAPPAVMARFLPRSCISNFSS